MGSPKEPRQIVTFTALALRARPESPAQVWAYTVRGLS
jgi:hypothetical protein